MAKGRLKAMGDSARIEKELTELKEKRAALQEQYEDLITVQLEH